MKWDDFIYLYPASEARMLLKDFTPDLQRFYTDISAISVTLCNSALISQLAAPALLLHHHQTYLISKFSWMVENLQDEMGKGKIFSF